MRLSVATNFDPELVERCRQPGHRNVRQTADRCGGWRSGTLPAGQGSRRQLEGHVRHVHKSGWPSTTCSTHPAWATARSPARGRRDIEELLGWVNDIGVTAVTVASPFMLQLIKARHPHLKVRISVFAGVDRVRKAQMWEDSAPTASSSTASWSIARWRR